MVIGRTPRRDTPQYWGGDRPWASIADMHADVITQTFERITDVGAQESGARLLGAGTLLMSFKLTIGKLAIAGVDLYTNEAIVGLVPRNPQVIDRDYLRYALTLVAPRAESSHAVKGRTLNQQSLADLAIPVPPLPEQRRIAAMLKEQLAAAERARAAAKERMAAASALPASYLRAAFANGSMDGWPVGVLEEIAELRPSRSIASDGEVEVVATTTACLSEAGFVVSGVKAARMSAEDAAVSMLAPGEVLVARSNTPDLVGRATLFTGAPSGVVASDLTIRVWPRDVLDASFLAAFLSYLFVAGYWKKRAGGASGSMKKITRTQLLAQRVPTPPLREQRQVARRLAEQMASAVQTCTSVEAELEAVDALPAALLRRAFSGAL